MATERPLQIVFLSAWLRFPHGMAATNRVRLLARALTEAGARVRVVVLQAGERPPHIENTRLRGVWRGVAFEYLAGTTRRHDSFVMRRLIELRGWTSGLLRLAYLARSGRMDVVYLWLGSQRLQLRRLVYLSWLRMLGVPVVIELNERPWSLRSDKLPWERLISPLWSVAGVVAISRLLSEWARSEAARLGGRREVVEVPILVDLGEQPAESGEAAVPPRVVFAASPHYDQATRFIISAMETVWRHHPDCHLAVTGVHPGEPAARWLLERGRRGGLDDRVEIVGYLSRAELLQTYGAAAALLAPLFDDVVSRARFPTKIGEYLASGRPVVATSVGEVQRYLRDGETAYLCPPGRPESFGERIVDVLDDPARASRVGLAGRRLAAREFHYSVHGPRLLAAFGRVVSEGGPRAT